MKVLLLALVLGIATPALAQQPCENVSSDEAYQNLINRGITLTQEKQFDKAIVLFQEAQQICAYDPVLTYAVARVHQLKGECKTAISLYKQAETQRASEMIPTSLTADKIAARLADAEKECAISRFDISCADADVTLQIGDLEPVACPAQGEHPAGQITIVASKEGYQPHTDEMTLEVGKTLSMKIPTLSESGPSVGTLNLKCPAGVKTARLVTAGGPTEIACPSSTELDPGNYTVAIPESDVFESFDIKAGKEVSVVLRGGGGGSGEPVDEPSNAGAWALTVSGVLVAGGGVALFFVADSMVQDIKDGCCTYSEAIDQQDNAEILHISGLAAIGAGSAMLVGGILMFALSGEEDDVDVSAGISREGFMLNWTTRW